MNKLPLEQGGIIPQMANVQPDGQMMGNPLPTEPLPDEPVIKGELLDWQGGTAIDLKKKAPSGKTVGDELSLHIKETLAQELKNQEKVIERLKRWNRLYKAEKRGARPKPWMADISIPVARKISDSIFVRIHDMVWNKVRVFLMRPRGIGTKEANEKMSLWEKAFNNYVRNDMNLKGPASDGEVEDHQADFVVGQVDRAAHAVGPPRSCSRFCFSLISFQSCLILSLQSISPVHHIEKLVDKKR